MFGLRTSVLNIPCCWKYTPWIAWTEEEIMKSDHLN